MSNYFAAGLGLSTLNQNGDPLEAYFPLPLLNVADATIALFSDALKDIATLGNTQSTYLLDANALRAIANALQSSNGDAQAEQLASIASALIDSKRWGAGRNAGHVGAKGKGVNMVTASLFLARSALSLLASHTRPPADPMVARADRSGGPLTKSTR